MSQDDHPALGLRERKKAKTRAAIQRHAFRLFREQGYEATTVSQIAEAAEISPSTFFRYFPSKEDVALYDDLDPYFLAAFEAQPPELSPIEAMRRALRTVFDSLPPEEAEQQWARGRLTIAVPELRQRMLDQVAGAVDLIAQMLAKRIGRSPDDLEVRTFAGAITGGLMAAMLTGMQGPSANFVELADAALAYIEAGMPI